MKTREEEDALALERVVFFSDAVMAIAITLLAIDLRLPRTPGLDEAAFVSLLTGLGQQYFAFFISFAVIGVYWFTHHRMFRYITSFDPGLLVLNMVFLFFVVQLPFLASILGTPGDLHAPTVVYAVGLSAMGLSSSALWVYARRRRLVTRGLTREQARYFSIRSLTIPLVFLVSVPVAFVSPTLAQVIWWLGSILIVVVTRIIAQR